MTDEKPTLLYGLPGDEYLDDDPYDTFGRWWDDRDAPIRHGFTLLIEEFSAIPAGKLVPKADRVLEWVHELICDDFGMDGLHEVVERGVENQEVVDAFTVALDLLGSKISGWSMADKKLRDIPVTWDDNGDPWMDGKPINDPPDPALNLRLQDM